MIGVYAQLQCRAKMRSALALTWLALAACSQAPFPIEPPPVFERDVLANEEAAQGVQAQFASGWIESFAARDLAAAASAFTSSFVARCPRLEDGRELRTGGLLATRFEAGPRTSFSAAEFLELLREYTGGISTFERQTFEFDRFFLGKHVASGRAELRLAGPMAYGGRTDLCLVCDVALVYTAGTWKLSALELTSGDRIVSSRVPFTDVTDEAGLHQPIGAQNRSMLQALVDEHVTLAVGGLTALDWNDDGFWDVLATRAGQRTTVFQNDGRSGFDPIELPLGASLKSPGFVLAADLDGNGHELFVSSRAESRPGGRGVFRTWSRPVGGGVLVPGELEFELPRSVRRVAVQTVLPLDADGDGRLDLYFGVYGNEHSRGENYNTVEAHDGGDNYLFIQAADGSWSEESDARGIRGTQYTYVAQAFDFDGDGDTDLFEGNDFGPNTLYLNDGKGQFVADEDSALAGASSYTMGVALADYDNSGRWSLYVANMSSQAGSRIVPLIEGLSPSTQRRFEEIASGNQLFTQSASGWIHSPAEPEVAECGWAWGCNFFDANGDGLRDLYVTNGFTSHSDASAGDWEGLYWRQVAADAGFLDRGEPSVDVNADIPFEGSFSGYERDRMFLQIDGEFVDAAYVLGLDATHDGRSVLPLDYDGDGDIDLALWTLAGLRLLRNEAPAQSFLRVSVTGPHSLGAVVAVTANGVTQRERVQLLEGFQTQVPRDLHFGLGDARKVESVEITWPNGAVKEINAPALNERLMLRQGEPATSVALPVWPAPAPAPEGTRIVDSEGQLRRLLPQGADESRALWERFLAKPPVFPELLVQTGRRQLAAHRYRPAIESFAAARDADPGLATVYEGIGRANVLMGRDDLAVEAYAKSVEVDPDYALGHFNLGAVRARLGRPEQAIAPLQTALEISGDHLRTLLLLGEAASVTGDAELALDAFTRATKLEPPSADAFLLLGKLHAQAKRYDLARSAFEAALGVNPDFGEARQLLRLAERLSQE